MYVQQDLGILYDQNVNEEFGELLPAAQQKCDQNYILPADLHNEKLDSQGQKQPSQLLKRSQSFLKALSDPTVFAVDGKLTHSTYMLNTNNKSELFLTETKCSSAPSAIPQLSPMKINNLQQNQQSHKKICDEPMCRICHDGNEIEELVSPCYCSGSIGLLHLTCLERWLGASQLTRCELCKYEFTIKRWPRALTEFIQDPPSPKHRSNLVCDSACLVVLTPLTVSSALLCAKGVHHYSQWPGSWQVQGLIVLTVCLILVYLAWLTVAIRHHYIICKKWREENQVVKITYISPVKCQRTLQSPSFTSLRLHSHNSSVTITPENITVRESVSNSWSQSHSSLVNIPLLKPILKYSSQLQASSWQNGLNGCTIVNAGCTPHRNLNNSNYRFESFGRPCLPKQETYV